MVTHRKQMTSKAMWTRIELGKSANSGASVPIQIMRKRTTRCGGDFETPLMASYDIWRRSASKQPFPFIQFFLHNSIGSSSIVPCDSFKTITAPMVRTSSQSQFLPVTWNCPPSIHPRSWIFFVSSVSSWLCLAQMMSEQLGRRKTQSKKRTTTCARKVWRAFGNRDDLLRPLATINILLTSQLKLIVSLLTVGPRLPAILLEPTVAVTDWFFGSSIQSCGLTRRIMPSVKQPTL